MGADYDGESFSDGFGSFFRGPARTPAMAVRMLDDRQGDEQAQNDARRESAEGEEDDDSEKGIVRSLIFFCPFLLFASPLD